MSMRSNHSDLPGRSGTSVVVGALVVVFAASALFAFSPSLNPLDLLTGRFLETTVPDVRGLTQQRALVALIRDRLRGEVTFAYDSEVPIGSVVRQDPGPGTQVERDSSVEIVVSRGPAFVTIPNLVGTRREDAVTQLRNLDLEVVETEETDEEVPANAVISVDPAPGVVVQGGSKVHLVISTGPEQRYVPDLSGVSLEGGAFFLGRAGLKLGQVTRLDSADVPEGAIIALDPPPATPVARDTPIDVTVSNGKPPVPVPGVVGRDHAQATRELAAAGFVIGEVTEMGPVGDPLDGVVRNQTPAPGTLLRPGGIVTITVRRAATPPPTTAPASTAPPTTAAPSTTTPAGDAGGGR